MSTVVEFVETCFSGANLPATMVLLLACLYWMLAILVGLDLDILDFDLNMDGEADLGEIVGVGVVVLRFLNIGRVPLMIWGSVFALTWWSVSVLLDRLLDDPTTRDQWFYAVQYAIRNLAIAVVLTKIFTQPLRGRFESAPPHPAESMLGRQCRVVSSEVNERFGQAEYSTEAAPLRIHVRTQGGPPLAKGDAAVIVAFDPDKQIYFVEHVKAEV
jgi:hypothetical protein